MSEQNQDLLLEVGTEELPPRALKGLVEAFASGFSDRLSEKGLFFERVEAFAAPRRLALLIAGVSPRQPEQEIKRRGPALSASFDADGSPTPAALGFARSCGVDLSALERERSEKGEWLLYRSRIPGEATVSLVPVMLEEVLGSLPIGKRMRWGDGVQEFVRPVHWICLLFGEEPIRGRVLGVEARPVTRGHRFHFPGEIALGHARDYTERLREVGKVEPSFELRRQMIFDQVRSVCGGEGLEPQIDPALLDEVTGLVEWPAAILGRFDAGFLVVPPEVLVETMQHNQRYFPVRRADGGLENRFVAVANIESLNPEQVRAGNERVIRPRFADAKFFWDQDLKQPLEGFFPKLESVVFQDRLGSLADKSRRVASLVASMATLTGVQPELVRRAALLGKCDLVSKMVFEFPALQGTMGGYYAAHCGERPEVSQAIEEQYRPRYAGDTLPASDCGRLLSVAERIDNLVGIFGIGERPTGAKDPYALRRASIAVIRILIESPLELDLRSVLSLAASRFPVGVIAPETVEAVLEYVLDRLVGYYQEQGIPEDRVQAVLAVGDTLLARIDRKVRAVHDFAGIDEAGALVAANKRIRNLLLRSGMADFEGASVDPALFESPREERLWQRTQDLDRQIAPLLEQQAFGAALSALASIRVEIDRFFEDVMVMVEDPRLRLNRLGLLDLVLSLFRKVADVSYLQ